MSTICLGLFVLIAFPFIIPRVIPSTLSSNKLQHEREFQESNDYSTLKSIQQRPSTSLKNRIRRQQYESFNKIDEHSVFDPSRIGGMICNLCIIVDNQFVTAYNLRDSSAVVSRVKQLVDRASWVFRNIDWNDDGVPDNLGFEVTNLIQGWNPFPDESQNDYATPKPSLSLLGEFAKQSFRSCCLGIGFTNRPFAESQVGVSFIASSQSLGGICDYRTPDPPLKSANVILISSIGLGGATLSNKDISVVLIHELGHTFGILKHDRDTNSPECSGFEINNTLPDQYKSEPSQGRYIMWGQDIQGLKHLKSNNLNFSPCSRGAVTAIMTSGQGRSSCLVSNQAAFCGNGIVEFPEECDCGNEVACAQIGCCGPRDSNGPCQFFKGIVTSNCLFMKDKKLDSSHRRMKNSTSKDSIRIHLYRIICQLWVLVIFSYLVYI